MKVRVSVEHRLIGSRQVFDTSTTIEAVDMEDALRAVLSTGVRGGHEAIGVSAYLVEDEKGGDSGNA